MRTEKFNFAKPATPPPATVTTTVAEKSFTESKVFDIGKELKRPVAKPATPVEPPKNEANEQKPNTPATPAPEPTPEERSAKLRETVEKTKETIEKELLQAIENPKRASKNVLKFLNMARLFLYPWLYKKIIFDGPEQTALDPMLKKIAVAKVAGKEPELNGLEKEMLVKWDFYQKQKLQIPWSEQEINDANDAAYMKLAEIKAMRWLLENEWAIVFIVMEGKRFGPVIAHRAGFGEISL